MRSGSTFKLRSWLFDQVLLVLTSGLCAHRRHLLGHLGNLTAEISFGREAWSVDRPVVATTPKSR